MLPKHLQEQDKKEMIAWYERELLREHGQYLWNVLSRTRETLEDVRALHEKEWNKLFLKDLRFTRIHELIKMGVPITVKDRDYYLKKLKV